jgi:beta-glucosidase
MCLRIFFFTIVIIFISRVASGQVYKDPKSPVEERVRDLLSRMTPEEKFRQLFMIPGEPGEDTAEYKSGIFGFQVNTSGQSREAAGQMLSYNEGGLAFESALKINEIQKFFIEKSRLGIPVIPFDEALHGLVRPGATAFPQCIGLAATWNPELMHEVAGAIATECSAWGIRQVLSPVVNIATDVRWGRTEETFGEDPFLTSEMCVAYVSAFEKRGIITTPKHFAMNVGDGGRDSYPVQLNERYMREIIFPPFEACIKKGGSRSLMTAYNSYDGTPCTANSWLLRQVLKKEWGFKGFVISDAGGTGGANVLHFTASNYVDATIKSLEGGLDVIFQTSYDQITLFSPPFMDGSIDKKTIDDAVARVLRIKFSLGLFENPYVEAKQGVGPNENPGHRDLAKKAALESIVLLKNDKEVLPIKKNIKSIAVIGPDADEARLGGYSGPGIDKVSILKGIRDLVGEKIKVNYSIGCNREDIEYVTVPSEALSCIINGEKKQGLKGDYFNNLSFAGDPVFTRCDPQVRFQWTLFSPDPEKLTYDFYSVRWTGKLKAPETGKFNIGIDGNDGYRVYLNGKMVLENWTKRTKQTRLVSFDFEKGRDYDLVIEYYEPTGNAWFSLIWNVGIKNDQDEKIAQAVSLVSESDIAIVVVGIEEGEFRDRAYLNLPGRQEELIRRVAAAGKKTIVLLVGGSAVTMNIWINDVDGILAVWYPGENGGNAVAEVLFGDYSPAGRLPITFPVFEGQLPLVYNHKPTGRGDDYNNLTGQPLFPFGYGLSYSRFEYRDIRLSKEKIAAGDSCFVTVNVINTGKFAGDEVVQLYLHDEIASVARPVTELKGFKRIHLNPGETSEVRFAINPEMLSMLDMNLHKVVEPGDFRIMVGASSKDIRQRAILKVTN